MYICKGCGQKNKHGVVHCSKCGVMLDINNVEGNEVKQDATGYCYTKHDRTKVIVKSIFGLSIYLVLFLILALLWPTLFKGEANYSTDAAALKRMKSTTFRSGSRVSVTEQELAYSILSTIRSYFGDGARWDSSAARLVAVEIVSAQRIKVIINHKMLNDNLPFDVTYLLSLPEKDEKFGKLELVSSSIGIIPLPKFFMSSINEKLTSNIKKTWLLGFISKIKYAYTKDGKITIQMRSNSF